MMSSHTFIAFFYLLTFLGDAIVCEVCITVFVVISCHLRDCSSDIVTLQCHYAHVLFSNFFLQLFDISQIAAPNQIESSSK